MDGAVFNGGIVKQGTIMLGIFQEAYIWGWLEVRRSARLDYTVNQCPHWTCQQYGHSEGTQGWLGDIGEQQWVTRFHDEHSVCVKCCRMIESLPRWRLSLSRPIQSDHLWITDCNDTAFGAGSLTWQDPMHSWKAGPGKVMTGKLNKQKGKKVSLVYHGFSAWSWAGLQWSRR